MKFVIPRGRLMNNSIKLLKAAGVDIDIDDERKLIFRKNGDEIILPRARDVPVYTEYAGDIGICGTDSLIESGVDLFAPLPLNFGICRLSILAPDGLSIDDLEGMDIATKHPVITEKYLNSEGIRANVIGLNGSLELAPETGIADAIVDIVQTGETMKKNHLVEIKKIMDIQATLVVNRVSQKTKYDEINKFVEIAGEADGNRKLCEKYTGRY
ncbi:MAG: ATP phosphoribosyltransferase [Ferroplasma sp.]|uniref:ATP phosphoribosyltransferase n=1 Tax=Ferroplasma sp. TaxID=2591003 RepID=UPI00281686A5|nr:ATP phosphoribosyltransferase [Ferroplasma sp.]WMT51129.1 MAG: ATP phosphoribosyltransferase [Ferroplasma sp.]